MKLSTTKSVCPCTKIQHIGCSITSNNIKMQPSTRSQNYLSLLHDKVRNSSCPIPEAKLRDKWMDYHGMKNWEGLLDPLDEGLRHEIIRYGHFVEAAYRSWDFDLSSSSYALCRYHKKELLNESGLSRSGYRVTKNLTAGSGIKLPGWAPRWVATQSSWIGYVAVCQDRKEISRLGRRDVVIALRGTATCLEWMENLRATLTPLPNVDHGGPDSKSDSDPMVESGFLSLYTSCFKNRSSLQKQVRGEIERILEKYGGNEPLSLTITGHSLGAALATLAAYDIKETFKRSPLVTVISFAGPRVGNLSFRRNLEEQGTKVLRIVNSDDVITKVPGFVVENNERIHDFTNKSSRRYMAAAAGWVHKKLAEDTQWVYADVGCELRLSSRDAGYLNGHNIATCHDLQTYLHLVNGFVSSNCPFRATARKMITKTLTNT